MVDAKPAKRSGRGPPWLLDVLTWVASIITIAPVVVKFFRGTNFGWMVNGWVGPTGLICGTGAFLAAMFLWRGRSRPWPAFFWFTASSALLAMHFILGGVGWQVGAGRWVLSDIPILLGAILLGFPIARSVMADRDLKVSHKLVALAVAAGMALVLLVISVLTAALAWSAFTATAPPVPLKGPTDAVTGTKEMPVGNSSRQQGSKLVVVYPPADSTCLTWFDGKALRPKEIDDDLWKVVLVIARDYASWKLCRVGSVETGADGLIDVKVFSATSGPEGHIEVERDIDGKILGRFVKPQAGQLYYQQPGGNPLISWGLPDPDMACGNGRIAIFRRPDHTIQGFSRWSVPISKDTRGTVTAYYTPASIAVPLLTGLERRGLTLPPAEGVVTLSPNEETSQNFAGEMTVRSDGPSVGSLTTSRLLAAC